jgi:hypothetical protein
MEFNLIIEKLGLVKSSNDYYTCVSDYCINQKDKNTTLLIYNNDNKLHFKCKTCGASGGLTKLVMLINKCTKQNANKWIKSNIQNEKKLNSTILTEKRNYKDCEIEIFQKEKFKFFVKYNVKESILSKSKVYAVKSYQIDNKKFESTEKNPIYMIEVNEITICIYKPLCKTNEIQIIGEQLEFVCLGLNTIVKRREVIITNSVIDMLILRSFGYNSVFMDIKNDVNIPEYVLSQLEDYTVFALLDSNEESLKILNELVIKYQFIKLDRLLIEMLNKNCNSFSELVVNYKENNLLEKLKELIRSQIDEKIDIDKLNLFLTSNMEEKLPDVIIEVLNLYQTRAKRELVLLSLITMFSSLYHEYKYEFLESTIHLNLYMIIVGEAGSGKGVIKIAKDLLDEIRSDFKSSDKNLVKDFIIPLNNTKTGLIKDIYDNEGVGLMFDSEIDSLNSANKSEFGDFSSVMRQIFHNEEILMSRKDRSEKRVIKNPRASLLISGTHNQVNRLIDNTEDGLFSRMMFKFHKNENPEKIRLFGNYSLHSETVKKISIELHNFYYKILSSSSINKPIQFSESQRENIEILSEELQLHYSKNGLNIGFANRVLSKILRIAIILTITRHFRDDYLPEVIVLQDIDIEIAKEIVNSLSLNSILMHNQLSKQQKHDYFKLLPNNFDSKFINSLALLINVSYKTIRRFVDDEISKSKSRIVKVSHGKYKKLT